MFRIDSSTAVAVMPVPAAEGTPGFFNQAPPGSGNTPTVVSADWLNGIQEEFISLLAHAAIDPDKATHDQVLQAILAIVAGAAAKASVADILAGVNDAKFITSLGLKGAMATQVLTDASTIPWNMNNGFRAKVTLGGARTLGQPTNLQEGATGSLQIIASTGSSLAYDACWNFVGLASPPASSIVAGKRDKLYFEVVDAVTPKIDVTFSRAA